MKDGILIACIVAIALTTYVLIPKLALLIDEWRLIHRERLLKSKKGLTGVCRSYSAGQLCVMTDDGQDITIPFRKTRFFSSSNTAVEFIPRNTISMIDTNIRVSIILPEKWRHYPICIFQLPVGDRAQHAGSANASGNGVKRISVAIGAFLEFLILLYSLGYADQVFFALPWGQSFIYGPSGSTTSILALVAIFAKALPYFPPGLFLTLAAHTVTHTRQQKSRRQTVGGFLLVMAGIALNVTVILFVIGKVGFTFP